MPCPWYCLNGPFYFYNQDQDLQWPCFHPIWLRRPLGYGFPLVVHHPQRLGAHGAIWCGHDYLLNTNPTTILGRLWKVSLLEHFHHRPFSSIQFSHDDQPTASLAAWTRTLPSKAMQHDVLLGRDSWKRFSERFYPPYLRARAIIAYFSDLTLSHQSSSGAVAFVSDFSAPTGGYHLYAGDRGISLTRDHQLVQVSLVRSYGAPAILWS